MSKPRHVWWMVLLSLFWAGIGVANERISLVPDEQQQLHVSYTLEDHDNDFFPEVLDALKAGQKVRVVHTVEIMPLGMLADTLGRVKYQYEIRYDLFDSRYTVKKDQREIFVYEEDELRQILLSVENLPLLESQRLKTGDEYSVDIQVRFAEMREKKQSWLDHISLKKSWKALISPEKLWSRTSLSHEEIYIAR